MNNLDKIIERILSDADVKAEEILSEARARAAEITEAGEYAVADMLKRAKLDAKREEALSLERAKSSADLRYREILLSAKVALINKTFAEAEQQIINAPDDEYCAFLSHLLADSALQSINTAKKLSEEYGEESDEDTSFEVIFNERDREKHAKTAVKGAKALLRKISAPLGKTELKISEETRPISGGLILKAGSIETNCSLEAVMAMARRNCEARVISALFDKAEEN